MRITVTNLQHATRIREMEWVPYKKTIINYVKLRPSDMSRVGAGSIPRALICQRATFHELSPQSTI
jgi:hypothetical protein